MSATRKLLGNLAAALLLLLATAPALAQEGGEAPSAGEVSRITVEVSNEIYSPFCPGKTLMMCPSPNAAKVRRDVQDMVRAGKSKEEIKNEIVAVYGEEFRLVEPPAQDNYALLTAILLGLALAAAAVVLLSRHRKRVASGPDHEVPTGPTTDEEIEEELSDDERAYLRELRQEYED